MIYAIYIYIYTYTACILNDDLKFLLNNAFKKKMFRQKFCDIEGDIRWYH